MSPPQKRSGAENAPLDAVTPALALRGDNARSPARRMPATRGQKAPHTDLDLYGQSGTTSARSIRWPVCPVKGHLTLVNFATGATTTGRCESLTCYACLWPQALRFGAAIALARPRWLVTLTQVGETWPEIHNRMKHLRKALTRSHAEVEYAWHVEPDPASPGHHVHMWMHGRELSNSTIPAAAAAAGTGPVSDVRALSPRPGGGVGTLAYGMKACEPPNAEVTSIWPEATRFLDANGGRLGHTTRGFWRDSSGSTIPSKREAVRQARAAQGRGTWGLI